MDKCAFSGLRNNAFTYLQGNACECWLKQSKYWQYWCDDAFEEDGYKSINLSVSTSPQLCMWIRTILGTNKQFGYECFGPTKNIMGTKTKLSTKTNLGTKKKLVTKKNWVRKKNGYEKKIGYEK